MHRNAKNGGNIFPRKWPRKSCRNCLFRGPFQCFADRAKNGLLPDVDVHRIARRFRELDLYRMIADPELGLEREPDAAQYVFGHFSPYNTNPPGLVISRKRKRLTGP